MVDGGAPVVDHTHREHGVEIIERWRQLLQSKRQDENWRLRSEMFQQPKLRDIGNVRIYTQYHCGTFFQHAETIVAVATTHS